MVNSGVTVQKSTYGAADLDRAVLAERHLRRRLPRQLREHQSDRPDHARSGHFQRAGFRRRAIRDAAVGEAGSTGEAQRHRHGHHQRRARAEHREPGRTNRRRTRAAGPGVHLHGARAGTAANAQEEFGEIVIRANPDGSLAPLERRRADRTRRADLQPERAARRATGRHPRVLPAPRLQRAGSRGRREGN